VIVSGLLAAGLIYAALLLGSVTALLTTGYGLALLLKILLVGALLWLASRNRLRIVPALVDGDASAAAALRRIIDLEVITVLAILALSAVLTSSLDLPMRGMG
jgi:putative copper resistance protein D